MGIRIVQKWIFFFQPTPFSHLHLGMGEYTHIHREIQPLK